ncbi:hypothetical protein KY330_03725 [Candidatus Woesearchaeota archaeon]|nr:hypothetical protein [Candidatus Woesearchaeota archaeon]
MGIDDIVLNARAGLCDGFFVGADNTGLLFGYIGERLGVDVKCMGYRIDKGDVVDVANITDKGELASRFGFGEADRYSKTYQVFKGLGYAAGTTMILVKPDMIPAMVMLDVLGHYMTKKPEKASEA